MDRLFFAPADFTQQARHLSAFAGILVAHDQQNLRRIISSYTPPLLPRRAAVI